MKSKELKKKMKEMGRKEVIREKDRSFLFKEK